ncbi:GNAT family N-acetyltransferase [Marispirochaeta aestuarii]|uniref:GNAT family N-acetyltransferase n=1 Tax=Marispirochaeta aestuarii TaxID=1963862 RepID=UPI0029C6E4D2|nr:GNAT family N-acetyltransferase [Marispirochaeta aestuarii]
MFEIKKVDESISLKVLHEIIRESFITVAKEFNLTEENAPTNPAYMTLERLKDSIQSGKEFFLAKDNLQNVGCIAIEADKNNAENYFIERLAVIPEKRHNKIGRNLLDYAISEIKRKKGTSAGIAIINENEQLKSWYRDYGFKETFIKNFEHLPFTVCFMRIDIE